MRFYVPQAGDKAEEDRLLLSMRQAVQHATRRLPTERRVHAIQFWMEGKQFDAEVGKPLLQIGLRHDQKGEEVIAILEAKNPDVFLVFTASNGIRKGTPLIVQQDDSFAIVDFDA